MKVHHVGYLIKRMGPAIEMFEQLGFVVEQETIYDPYRKINICFMTNGGERIELIESAAQDSIVAGLLKKKGIGPYHICYEVPDLKGAIDELTAAHYFVTDAPEVAVALDNRKVAFLFHSRIGLIEVLEEKK